MATGHCRYCRDRILSIQPHIYIAASFKHKHAVRLLGRELRHMGFVILDWTEKATPPAGLTSAERRQWMDTDMEGGQVFSFCRDACLHAHMLIYFGESGQDAGVEVGLACGAGVPVLGVRGPLEAPGLMLHGAMTAWVESVEGVFDIMQKILQHVAQDFVNFEQERDVCVRSLCIKMLR